MDESEVLNKWQIDEITKALVESDHGEFASEDEVQQMIRKWTQV